MERAWQTAQLVPGEIEDTKGAPKVPCTQGVGECLELVTGEAELCEVGISHGVRERPYEVV